jgi:transcriptional regulator with XRE-family HTH domain
VAARAGIDPGYYAKLEQGRATAPSAEVLEAIGHALQLDETETEHLFDLGHQVCPERGATAVDMLPQGALDLLGQLHEAPALIAGRQWDLLAWNDAMCAVFGDPTGLPAEARNVVWMMFSIPEMQRAIEDWAGHAQRLLSQFRYDWGRHRGDPRFAELIADLNARSPEFRAWWPLHHVQGRQNLQKTVTPSAYGRPITFTQSTWLLSDGQNVKLVIYAPLGSDNLERAQACMRDYLESNTTA